VSESTEELLLLTGFFFTFLSKTEILSHHRQHKIETNRKM
jgi:hypothetical protein